ncbi:hypothetical protein BKA65DRAFT_581187 [Rhexocercosporidium sp. MPI-PUGE-AT-0058]|nr:hypothetical protein BKA65DRAFT_581187 [Rhexocercosporidium sp. MPI-PUGE-AT-0058]
MPLQDDQPPDSSKSLPTVNTDLENSASAPAQIRKRSLASDLMFVSTLTTLEGIAACLICFVLFRFFGVRDLGLGSLVLAHVCTWVIGTTGTFILVTCDHDGLWAAISELCRRGRRFEGVESENEAGWTEGERLEKEAEEEAKEDPRRSQEGQMV